MAIEHVLEVPPVRMTTVPGFDTAVFPYTTDIPFLARWGEPLLFGPGSIHVAHTADESMSIAELTPRSDSYVRIARELLSGHEPLVCSRSRRLPDGSHRAPASSIANRRCLAHACA